MEKFVKKIELAKIALEKFNESGINRHEMAKKLNVSYSYINHALNQKDKIYNQSRNGLRIKILNSLGFEVIPGFQIKKIQKN